MKRLPVILGIVTCIVFALSFTANAEFEDYVLQAECVDNMIAYSVNGDATAGWEWHNGDCLVITVTVLQNATQIATYTHDPIILMGVGSETLLYGVDGSFIDMPCGPLTVTSRVVWYHLCNPLGLVHHDLTKETSVECTCDYGDGCTPGYWKNHLDMWVGFAPGDDFDSTFGVDLFTPDITLGEAINAKGGGVNKLARHGTAALLNCTHPEVDYAYECAEVIALVQAGNVDPLQIENEIGCPID